MALTAANRFRRANLQNLHRSITNYELRTKESVSIRNS
jgi:hypothetical protein